MDDKHDDGGPAFPKTGSFDERRGEYVSFDQDGMTLRDYFAGQAMAGLLASGSCLTWAGDARNAYKMADAMIAERKKCEASDDAN